MSKQLTRCYNTMVLFLCSTAISFAQTGVTIPYTVQNGIIVSDNALPSTPLWFADSRLAFSFDETGVAQADYYNPVGGQNMSTIFLRQLWDGFRYFIEKDNKTYTPSFRNNKIWPFGMVSEWNIDSIKFIQRVMAINGAIVLQVEVPANIPASFHFKMEFFEAFGLTKGSDNDLRYSDGGLIRQWKKWEFSATGNTLTGGFTGSYAVQPGKKETPGFENLCTIGASFPMEHVVKPINTKHILRSAALQPGKTYSFFISFAAQADALMAKNNQLVQDLPALVQQQFDRYRATAGNAPVLKSSFTALNNFISLAPMYHESLKIMDYPGAMRAKTSNYWVWGWDGMTSNEATAFWGDTKHIKDMLRFYESTADSAKGIAHAYGFDMKPTSISALPAQGMYISLLQLYYGNTGDIQELKERYPFAKNVFNRIAATEVAGTGFCKGSSLFPDFPEAMGETGEDISGFNNTIFYCAARSMEWLAALTGDKEQQKKSSAIARSIESNFAHLFFNREKKFVVSSIDAKTLQQRDSYTTNAIRWENNYCADITDSINAPSLDFFKANAVTPMGLREIPLWNKSFDADANQLHCWWPATGEYFMRLINGQDQPQLINQWIKWVSYWTNHLTCPEGISYYIETAEPAFDRWTSQQGTWQGYSMRGWYQAALHGVVGIGTDAGGLTFYPYSGEEMSLEGLNYRDRKFDIAMKGSGPYIASIEADGIVVQASNKLPADMYADMHKNDKRVKVTVNRVKENPYPVSIAEATGTELHAYHYVNNSIKVQLVGAGFCRVAFKATRPFEVRIGGKKVTTIYQPASHTGYAVFYLQPGKLTEMIAK